MQKYRFFGFFKRLIGLSEMSTEPVRKKVCTMKKIGTHSGTFHCDEVLACFMLKKLPEYKDAQIMRTRDQSVLDTCDIVVDVGGVFDPSKHRYDHHQRSFDESMHSLNLDYKWVTKLSSAGLVYYHFGHRVVAEVLRADPDDAMVKVIYNKTYELFVEEVDGGDNGISQCEGKPKFAVTTTLGSRVGHLNPRWDEIASDENMLERFQKAMTLVGTEFVDRITYLTEAWWPARALVKEAVNKRHTCDSSGEIIVFPETGCPWKDHLLTLEEEMKIEPSIKFVLYTDQSGKWRVQCVPVILGSFENRLSLLEEWRGVRDEELSQLSGIPGCIFVHINGFIGGNQTYDGALEMARRTLQGKPHA